MRGDRFEDTYEVPEPFEMLQFRLLRDYPLSYGLRPLRPEARRQ